MMIRRAWSRVTRPNMADEDGHYLGVVLVPRHITRVKDGRLIDRPMMTWGWKHGWKVPSWIARSLVHGLNVLFCLRYGHDVMLLGLAEYGYIPFSGACCTGCGANLDRTKEAQDKLWRREAYRDKLRWITRLRGL